MSRSAEHPPCRIPHLRKRNGRCYELTFSGACRAPEWVIVHGEFAAPPLMVRLGHAWLEFDGKVYDAVLDRVYPREEYLQEFDATEHARYTFQEAAMAAGKAGHYGPWHLPPKE